MTKTITVLHTDEIAVVDDIDYDLVSGYVWGLNGGYPRATVNKKQIYMHHLIIGKIKGKYVDHINGNRYDNRRENLRFCSHGQNRMNSVSRTGRSKYKGVYYNKEKSGWDARISAYCKRHFLGRYKEEESAAAAYNEAAKVLHGEYARLNEIQT